MIQICQSAATVIVFEMNLNSMSYSEHRQCVIGDRFRGEIETYFVAVQ